MALSQKNELLPLPKWMIESGYFAERIDPSIMAIRFLAYLGMFVQEVVKLIFYFRLKSCV